MAKEEHRSTARVLSILTTLSDEPDGLTLAELAQKLDAPKSSLFPILHTMADLNFITYHESAQQYTIGLNTYLVGTSYIQKHNVLNRIQDEMEQIVLQCSEVCQFGVLEGNQVLYLAKADSPQPVQLSSYIGKRLPAYCTSLGKSLLSGCNMEALNKLYPGPLIPFTQNTVKDLEELYSQLQTIRETSIAVEQGETHPDISCLSTPLLREGEVAASISVSVPTFRFTPEKRGQIEQVLLHFKPRLEKLLEQNPFIY